MPTAVWCDSKAVPCFAPHGSHTPLLGPDDLRPDRKPALGKAVGDNAGAQRPVPDIGDLAGVEIPGRSPIRDLVVPDLALARGIVDAPAMTPLRIIFDAVGRVGDHQMRHGIAQQKLHEVRVPAVAARDTMRSELPDVPRPRYRHLSRYQSRAHI